MSLKLKGTVKPGEADRRYYMIRVQVDGRREVLSAGTRDRKLAERREQDVVTALQKQPTITKAALTALVRGETHLRTLSALKASEGLTLGEAFKRCFADPQVWGRIKSGALYLTNTRHVEAHFGKDRVLDTITVVEVKAYIKEQLTAGSAPGTINRRLACLGKMFSAMRELPDGPRSSPKITYLKEEGARKFSLTHAQEETLFAAVASLDNEKPGAQGGPPRKLDAHEYLGLFKVLVESGMRLGEALRLRWTDLEMTPGAAVIRLHRVKELKNGKARTVPMTDVCLEVLTAIREVPHRSRMAGPFAGLNKRRAQHIWLHAVKKTDIDDPECVIHSLRHTCATRLLKATGNLVLVKDWLGHTTIKTTADCYAHVESDSMVDGAAALSAARGTHRS
jgi:integrase